MNYYVYEFVQVTGTRSDLVAVIHLGGCPACNEGEGLAQNAGYKHRMWKWHGPLGTFEEAKAVGETIVDKPKLCKRCHPK